MALTHEKITEKLTAQFGPSIISSETPYNFLTIMVAKDKIKEIITFLKNDAELNFLFLTDITGTHFPDDAEGDMLGVVYHLHNLVDNVRLRLKIKVPKNAPYVDSMTSLYSGANWMERETFDFFGIIFNNHPNLKRVLNVDDMDYHPLRKEYALEDPTRDDKEDKFFGR